MDWKLALDIAVPILSAVGSAIAVAWRKGKSEQKAEDRLAAIEKTLADVSTKPMTELELERVRGALEKQIGGKLAREDLSGICTERHRLFEQELDHVRRLASGTGVQVSVSAVRERIENVAAELHEKMNAETKERADRVHSLARDLAVLQNGVADLVRARNEAEAAVIQRAADSRAVETKVASLQDQTAKLEDRVREVELSFARLQASLGGR